MKQKLKLILIVFSFFAISTFSQSLKIGIGGGYTALSGDNNFTAENVLNLNSGYHYGGKIIASIPLIPIQFAVNIYQNSLSSEVTEPIAGTTVTSETSFSSFGLGAEFTLLPGPVQPYLAADLLFTSLGDSKLNDITISSGESKTGLGFGAGVYFKLIPIIDLDLSVRYNMNTLLSDGDALNSTHIRLNVLYSIL
jgi:opacity protein-like surface antigen